MAVDKVTRLAEEIIEQSRADSGTVVATRALRTYEVSMTTMTDTAAEALAANDGTTAIPAPGTAWNASNTLLRARTPQAVRVGNAPLFRVTVPWSIASITFGGRKAVHPTSRAVLYHEFGQPGDVEVDTDAAGALIRNSAGQVLKTTVPHADMYIQAAKNTASRINYRQFFCRANNASYSLAGTTYAAEEIFLHYVDQEEVEEVYEGQLITYYRATFHFYVRVQRASNDPDTWRAKILNRGTVSLLGTAAVPNTDATGNIITEPVNLDHLGAMLAPGATPYWLASASTYATDGATSRVAVIQTANFASLGL